VVDVIYDAEFIRTMIIEKYPNKIVTVQDSLGGMVDILPRLWQGQA
jgi:hypothetical protein